MFKVGKTYRFTRIIGGDETDMWGEVEAYEHPLVKIADKVFKDGRKPDVMRGEIINVTSPNFVSAEER